jgi:hypothetical protein
MVSGVGPEEILRKHDIPIVSARPGIGQEMWDHVLFGVVYEANLSTTAILQDQTVAAEYASQYLANATGILASQNTDYLGASLLSASNNTRTDVAHRMGKTSSRQPSQPQLSCPSRSRRVPTGLARNRIRGRILLDLARTGSVEELYQHSSRADHPVVSRERLYRVVEHGRCSPHRCRLAEQLD